MFIENFWLFVIVVMCVGGILGFAFFSLRYRNSKRIQQLQEQLEAKTEELESYRGDVNEHFLKTAELVDNLTQSYKAVYDHLEGGAYRLVGEESFRKQLSDRKQLQLEAFSSGAPRELGGGHAPGGAPSAAAVVIEEDLAEEGSPPPPADQGAPHSSPRVRAGARVVRVEEVEEGPQRRSA